MSIEQRERIQKLTYADADVLEDDPFQTNYVDHEGVVQEESVVHRERRVKLEKIVAEAETKGEEEGITYAVIGVFVIAAIFYFVQRRKRL